MSETRVPSHVLLLAALWALLLAAAFAVDRPVAEWVKRTVPVDKRHANTKRALEIVKLPGWFPVTLSIAVLVGVLNRSRGRGALALVLSAVIVGAAYSVIKWIVGRHRPVRGIQPFTLHPFPRGIAGLWREEALCFPSGHASLAFATATCLAMLLPRWRWAFVAVAVATTAERVLENAHYVSDVVAGAGLGAIVAWVLTRAALAGARDAAAQDGVTFAPRAHGADGPQR